MPISNGTKKARARYSEATSAMTASMPTAAVRREIRGACLATSAGAAKTSAATSATTAVPAAPAGLGGIAEMVDKPFPLDVPFPPPGGRGGGGGRAAAGHFV